mmetsp:Transcript_9495/g.28665  ORF Transcript_9495/g.28665 Transcript_9495/m.28665 type:complete len:512 (+) Transcript_9495:243-1778(+)|eukprot:CAMPEP_0198736962 /NCGR_PEP_ID=MMETSP1475-20131203/67624_1 /TAXON_ID= ORGANISM="Unidentified sp., Strain CCMP1999" /NCGR_SAMPLE_ID=MMETSP1475 /ASSEMBLY_ACC=CAM_ASM_001111 /LENGTH=511 /DNA_ID=CAMNT_0044500817 /DNA_START=222 /DNA_END=1757 /DNA_ORIENTATION=+
MAQIKHACFGLAADSNVFGSKYGRTVAPRLASRPKIVRTRTVVMKSAIAPWLTSFSAAASAGSLFGFDIGSSSSVIRVLGEQGVSTSTLSTVASAPLLGALIASAIAVRFGNEIGRRKELQVSFALYLIGTLTQVLSPSTPVLLAGRVLYGLGIGAAMHGAPLLISESVPSKRRGSLVALKEAFIVGGILVGYVSGAAFAPLGPEAWRYMFGAAVAIEIPGILLATRSPESPRFLTLRALMSEGETAQQLQEAAKDSQTRLNGGDNEEAERTVREMAQNLGDDLKQETQGFSLSPLLNTPGAKAALICGLGLVLFQQLTGQPSVLYFANRIFEDAGMGYSAAVALGIFKLVTTVGSAGVVERFGRRGLLIAGSATMTACLAALSAIFSQIPPDTAFTSVQQWSIVSFILLYVGGYQIGFGPITWLMLSEIFPLRVRGAAVGIGTLANFGSNLLVASVFEAARVKFGSPVLFATFAAIGALSVLFEASYLPETKGKTLEEIESVMREKEGVS